MDANYAAQDTLKPGSEISVGDSAGGDASFKDIGVVGHDRRVELR